MVKQFTRRRSRMMLAAFAVTAAAAGIATALALSNGDAADSPEGVAFERPEAAPTETGALSMIDARFSKQPRALSIQECTDARPRMEAQVKLWEARLTSEEPDSLRRLQLQAAASRSRAWFDAGCPADELLGYYEATDRSGDLKSIILDFPR